MIFWLSFCDSNRPKGRQFLGAAVVEANDLAEAITKSWPEGCNPGGEVLSAEIPKPEYARVRPHLNRLMQREELERLFGECMSPDEIAETVDASRVCPACNGVAGTTHTHVN